MSNLSDYSDFFLFLGSLLMIGGVVYLFFRRSLQNIFISEEAISRLEASKQILAHRILSPKTSKNIDSQALLRSKKRDSDSFKKLSVVLLIFIVVGFLFNQFLMWRMGSSGILNKLFSISINITKK